MGSSTPVEAPKIQSKKLQIFCGFPKRTANLTSDKSTNLWDWHVLTVG